MISPEEIAEVAKKQLEIALKQEAITLKQNQTSIRQEEESRRLSELEKALNDESGKTFEMGLITKNWIKELINEELYLLYDVLHDDRRDQEEINEQVKSTLGFHRRSQEEINEQVQSTLGFQKTIVNRARALANEELQKMAELESHVDLLKREWRKINEHINIIEYLLKNIKKNS